MAAPVLTEVALFVSAWIETKFNTACLLSIAVALFVSAWIETSSMYVSWLVLPVALFVSAWIETLLFDEQI